jgi:hypothetical protein
MDIGTDNSNKKFDDSANRTIEQMMAVLSDDSAKLQAFFSEFTEYSLKANFV